MRRDDQALEIIPEPIGSWIASLGAEAIDDIRMHL